MKRLVTLLIVILISCLPVGALASERFKPFIDFRHWSGALYPKEKRPGIYTAYMEKFKKNDITVLMLINPNNLPPFKVERKFLEDAARRGVKVWVRTVRVTPKRGVPGEPNSTLDFALNYAKQEQALQYLLDLAALSKEYPNFTGLIIGGEEWVGHGVDQAALERYNDVALKELGFPLTGKLTDEQKIRYFDWLEDRHNRWYGRIWDTLKGFYPKLELFIYPTSITICGGRWSGFPRPVYWDIYDLIVTRDKRFNIIMGEYNIYDPQGPDLIAADGIYFRSATKGVVPYHLLLQVQRDIPQYRSPTREELETQALAAVASGASGVGYWPIDMDSRKDIFWTEPQRWEWMFQAIKTAAQHFPQTPKGSGLFVVKPRYSQYWQPDYHDTLRTLALLRRAGLDPEFLLVEQILSEPLPARAKAFYIPETFKYESPQVLKKLLASGKPVFFGLGPAEAFTPDKQPQPPWYQLLGLKKTNPSGVYSQLQVTGVPPARAFYPPPPEQATPQRLQEVTVTWEGKTYKLALTLPDPLPSWQDSGKAFRINGEVTVGGKKEMVPLVFGDGKLLFFAASDYNLLRAAGGNNQNEQFIKALLSRPQSLKKPEARGGGEREPAKGK